MPLTTLRKAVHELTEAQALAFGSQMLAMVGPSTGEAGRLLEVSRSLGIAVLTYAARLQRNTVDRLDSDEPTPIEWERLEVAIKALSEAEAMVHGRRLVRTIVDVHDAGWAIDQSWARFMAVTHELGCALADHADDQRRLLEAADEDLEGGPAIGYQLGEDPGPDEHPESGEEPNG